MNSRCSPLLVRCYWQTPVLWETAGPQQSFFALQPLRDLKSMPFGAPGRAVYDSTRRSKLWTRDACRPWVPEQLACIRSHPVVPVMERRGGARGEKEMERERERECESERKGGREGGRREGECARRARRRLAFARVVMKHLTLMCAGTDKRLHACSQEASMSCTVLVVAKNGASKPMVAHTLDTAGATDFRLVKGCA